MSNAGFARRGGRQQLVEGQREPARAAQHIDLQAEGGDAQQMQPVRADLVPGRVRLPDLGKPPSFLRPGSA